MTKFFLSSLVRTLFWAAIGISLVAIGLGRSVPRTAPAYHAVPVRYHGVNTRCFLDRAAQPCFLDRESGQILQVPFTAEDTLDYAICSPWQDENGEYHVVSRWMKRAGTKADRLPKEFGLARFTLPGGKLIDRVTLEQLPIGEPCWIPGETPRILFASGDGVIYRYSFEEAQSGPVGDTQDHSQAKRITWRTAPPGTGLVYVRDLIWPTEKQLGGRLIASLCYRVREGDKIIMVGPELWWLELSSDITTIEAAGRLVPGRTDSTTASRPVVGREFEQRLPSIAQTAEGGLALAYLQREGTRSQWELRVAPLVFDPQTGAPGVAPGTSHGLARGFVTSAPAFSTDGRYVYGIFGQELGMPGPNPRRYSVANALFTAGVRIAGAADGADTDADTDPLTPARAILTASITHSSSSPRIGLWRNTLRGMLEGTEGTGMPMPRSSQARSGESAAHVPYLLAAPHRDPGRFDAPAAL